MTKAWTVSRGPIAATPLDVQKADAINALLLRPAGILPAAPGDQIKPFAIGLFDEIRALLKPEIGATALRRAVGAFVHSKRYNFATAQPDSMRHDVEGKAVEPVSDTGRLLAQERFLTLKPSHHSPDASDEPAASPSKADLIRASLLGPNRPAPPSAG